MRRKSAVGGIVSRRRHGVLQRRSVNNSMSELQNYANFAGGLATGALGHIVGLNTHRARSDKDSPAGETTRREFRCQTLDSGQLIPSRSNRQSCPDLRHSTALESCRRPPQRQSCGDRSKTGFCRPPCESCSAIELARWRQRPTGRSHMDPFFQKGPARYYVMLL